MQYVFKSSFDRALKKLPDTDKIKVSDALDSLFDFFDRKTNLPVGLGLKPIGKNYWEIRADLRMRILFELDRNLVTFYFVGNHDQIRQFIRN